MQDNLIDAAWTERLTGFKQLVVGFSGGMDSTVLLHALAFNPQLSASLLAVHVNHGLSPNAAIWQRHCESLCAAWGIPLMTRQLSFTSRANLEAKARSARRAIFAELLQADGCVVLAQHRDDQAETVLLQLCRGAGVVGLGAMRVLSVLRPGMLARPLLMRSRSELHAYATQHHLTWVDDESNQHAVYTRNYLRHHVLPLLRARWPSVVNAITQSAGHCQQAQSNLSDLADLDCPHLDADVGQLRLVGLGELSMPRLSNVLRVWLIRQGVPLPSTKLFSYLLRAASESMACDKVPCIAWGGIEVRRYRHTLYLVTKTQESQGGNRPWHAFPKDFLLGAPAGVLRAVPSASGVYVPMASVVEVRYRCAGETIVWRGKTRALKQLFQQWGVPPWIRQQVPLVFVDGILAAIVGFCVSDAHYRMQGDRLFEIICVQPGVT